MNSFLVFLITVFAIAAGVALVRGLIAFVRDAEHIRMHGEINQEAFGVKQNRMMTQRLLYQGIAILLVALVGALAAKG